MYPYDASMKPPAPSVPVRITNPIMQFTVDSTAVLDTGSSVTVVPQSLVRQLRLLQIGSGNVIGVERLPIGVFRYQVRLEVAQVSLGVIEVVGANFPHILLGRDILNQFDITLRGKMQVCELTVSEAA